MGIFRRSGKSSPPLRRRQQQIAQQEAELRDKLERLERMIITPRGDSTAQREEEAATGARAEKRFHVSVALQGEPSVDAGRSARRPRALRKQRREGQMIFLFLLTALAAAVMWLISHLHS
jgi:hypothetical protein